MDTAQSLSALGAQYFLFASLPDFGVIPDATLTPTMRATATTLTNDFNADLAQAIASFAGGTAYFADMAAVYDAVYADLAAFGITDTAQVCVSSGTFGQPQNVGTACGLSPAIQDTYLYFDEIHPTAVMHAEIGAAALVAVPEPSAATLLSLGIAVFVLRRRGERGRVGE